MLKFILGGFLMVAGFLLFAFCFIGFPFFPIFFPSPWPVFVTAAIGLAMGFGGIYLMRRR